jgi:hypothetical protein
MKEYTISHKRRGCYEVCLVYPHGEVVRSEYLTNFRNKKAAKRFIEEHQKGKVTIDPDTCIPTPDFK